MTRPAQRCTLAVEQLESRDVPSSVKSVIVPGHYIITLNPGVDAQAFAREMLQRGNSVSHVYTHGINGIAMSGARPGYDPRIAAIEADQLITLQAMPAGVGKPDFEGFTGNKGKSTSPPPPPPAFEQIVPTGVARIGLSGGTGADFSHVNVAIIDTGIDGAHEDLNVVGGINYSSSKINQLRENSNWADDNGHGTHVAGTVAALDNDIGVVGVAPGASLWSVKVLNRQGSGYLSGIIAGIEWVTATRTDSDPTNDIAVANMSLGVFGSSTALHNAIQASVAQGVVYVVAAMNSNTDASQFSPAAYSEVITVSALADSDGKPGGLGAATSYGADDTLATFSNFGAAIDIAAPGVDILSTTPGNKYAAYTGTSMASPHVAGMVVRYIALYGQSNADGKYILVNASEVASVRDQLIASAQPMSEWGPDAIASDKDNINEGLVYLSDVSIAAFFLAPNDEVRITVVNLGAATQETVFAKLYVDGVLVDTVQFDGLEVGESSTLSFDWNVEAGQTLEAVIFASFDLDRLNDVAEPLVV